MLPHWLATSAIREPVIINLLLHRSPPVTILGVVVLRIVNLHDNNQASQEHALDLGVPNSLDLAPHQFRHPAA